MTIWSSGVLTRTADRFPQTKLVWLKLFFTGFHAITADYHQTRNEAFNHHNKEINQGGIKKIWKIRPAPATKLCTVVESYDTR